MNQISKKVNPFSAAAISNGLSKVGELLKTKKFWVELIIMTLGMFVAALGVYFFLIPSKLCCVRMFCDRKTDRTW